MSLPVTASAHVKWFSNFSFADRPRTWQEALTATTWALMALSMLALGVLVFLGAAHGKEQVGQLDRETAGALQEAKPAGDADRHCGGPRAD